MQIFQVDAFTQSIFGGNPAAVVPLNEWLPDDLMQAIAAENNLAETAFFYPDGEDYRLRWFTPNLEIDLCGHATLAAAHVLFEHLGAPKNPLCFHTRSGLLTVTKQEAWLSMDFPARPPEECPHERPILSEALGLAQTPLYVGKSRDYLVELSSEAQVRAVNPNMALVAKLDAIGVIVTAPGEEVDFVSRFFAPQAGVPEDPVTGSAHSTLIPFWAEKLDKNTLLAQQVSARLGQLKCEYLGERVLISGQAVTYLEGEIQVPGAGGE
ncbi:MAG: PhzF family phenazine biosynthesis protein [Bacteroidota bacterium]